MPLGAPPWLGCSSGAPGALDLSWPVGFAVTELVAYHLITGYVTNVAIGYGLTPGQLDPASLASVLGGVALCILELLVAFIQAYIFAFLTALFIGMAVHQH